MFEKIYRLADGDEIIIKVPGGNRLVKPSLPARPRPKGIIKKRFEKTFARRILKSGITIYDWGRLLIDGVKVDNPFTITPEWISDSAEPYVREVTLADFTARDASLLAVNQAEWLTKYPKISKAEAAKFDLYVYSDDFFYELDDTEPAKWTDGGLKLTGAELASPNLTIGNSRRFFADSIVLTGDGRNKITSEPDPNADAVAFALSPNAKICLVPELYKYDVKAFLDRDEGGEQYIYYLALNYFFRYKSRKPLDADNPFYQVEGNVMWDSSGTDLENYLDFLQSVEFHKSLPGVRAIQHKVKFSDATKTISALPVSDFLPTNLFPPDAEPIGFGQAQTVERRLFEGDSFTNLLVAVIYQNNSWFYVWK